MSSKLIGCIAVLIILSLLVLPSSLSADDDDLKYLTLRESMFLVGIMPTKIDKARDIVNKCKGIVGSNPAAKVNGEIFKAGQFPKISDCFADAPETLTDISYTWNTFVCSEFDAINRKAESIQKALRDENFSAFSLDYLTVLSELSDIRSSLNNIESELSRIEKMIAVRVNELIQKRKGAEEAAKLAKEAEREAKDELKLGDDSCFIATAAYGSQTAQELNILRAFRDSVLMQSEPGRWLVSTYYSISPPLATFIAGQETIRFLIRKIVLDPIVDGLKGTRLLWDRSLNNAR